MSGVWTIFSGGVFWLGLVVRLFAMVRLIFVRANGGGLAGLLSGLIFWSIDAGSVNGVSKDDLVECMLGRDLIEM